MENLKAIIVACLLLMARQPCHAWSITDSFDGWTTGTDNISINNGNRPDGSNGPYLHLGIASSSPLYYEAKYSGEGMIQFWINDPGNCMEGVNPGYSNDGPKWGLQNEYGQACAVGISRHSHLRGCLGYSVWSTVDYYNHYWFNDGLRGSDNISWQPGWYKWTIYGTMDDISFTIHDVDYDECDSSDCNNLVHGDLTKTYNATSFNGKWTNMFGDGWNSFYLKGEPAMGIEEIGVYVMGGNGGFNGVSDSTISGTGKMYNTQSWGRIKKLYR